MGTGPLWTGRMEALQRGTGAGHAAARGHPPCDASEHAERLVVDGVDTVRVDLDAGLESHRCALEVGLVMTLSLDEVLHVVDQV